MGDAVAVGASGAAWGVAGAGVAVGALHQLHKPFRNNVGISGKVASVVMIGVFSFVYNTQREISRQQKRTLHRRHAAAAAKR